MMKKTLLNILCGILLFAFVAGLSSCTDNSVDVNYKVTITKDLLKFVTPTVISKDKHGNEQSRVLVEENAIESNGQTLTWSESVNFKDFEKVDAGLTVKYAMKEGVDPAAETYLFGHKICLNGYSVDTDGVKVSGIIGQTAMSQIKTDEFSILIDCEEVKKDEVAQYLNNLTSNPDKYQFDVDKKGNITSNNIQIGR